ncbi:MAG: hypothetical protein JNK90_09450 [Planctomycetaceae bacterium]|nr:hypothetical protein [Planctomycetaceae bacterium]
MIFKRQFFTLLLGLLFAVALTDQASALYDPGVGRFCSRDPIGYAGGQEQLYRYGNSTPHIETDSLGLCVDCESRGGKLHKGLATLVDEIIDFEMDALFKRWKAPNERQDPDIEEIDRHETPKRNPKRIIWLVYHQRRYQVVCCKESDGTMTLEKLEEQELKPRELEYATASFSVPLPWALTEVTKEAYVKFVHPVPYWQYGRADQDWGKCLAATGFTNLGTRVIKKDSEIEGGAKE